jgi:hypothetical protein
MFADSPHQLQLSLRTRPSGIVVLHKKELQRFSFW